MVLDARKIVELLHLEPLEIEGGLYRQVYRADEEIPAAALPGRYQSPRPMGTAIYFLLENHPDSFSALHRLLTDEIYHFYLGDPVEMTLLYPDGRSETIILGPDLLHGQQVQFVVPAGVWQGSRLQPGGNWALLGTTMAPGYVQEDFTLGDRAELLKQYPQARDAILNLTR